MLRKIILVILFLAVYAYSGAQNRYVLSGNISDASTGEDLAGAAIAIEENLGTGTFSNSYGFYSLKLERGKYHVRFQFIGYETRTIEVDLHENVKLDVELKKLNY